MKKFCLLILAAISLTGCTGNISNQPHKENVYPYSIYKVEYECHTYIVFRGSGGSGYYSGMSSGVVHDPDCSKCQSK